MKVQTRDRVGRDMSKEFEVKVGLHQGSVLSLLVFAIMVDMVTESVRNGLMSEMLYVDDLVLSETMEGLRKKFWNGRRHSRARG